mgnify:CR=1 FL=1
MEHCVEMTCIERTSRQCMEVGRPGGADGIEPRCRGWNGTWHWRWVLQYFCICTTVSPVYLLVRCDNVSPALFMTFLNNILSGLGLSSGASPDDMAATTTEAVISAPPAPPTCSWTDHSTGPCKLVVINHRGSPVQVRRRCFCENAWALMLQKLSQEKN